jgi:hypothetical protein
MTYDTIAIPGGYVKLRRSPATRELLKDGNAFLLLTAIALRAKRTDDFSIHGLQPGQALVGDHASYGLTQQEYRCAKVRLKRYGLADFKATSQGTIATLCDETIYDINVTTGQQTENERTTNEQRAGNDQATTIKNEKNKKKGKGPPLDGSGGRRSNDQRHLTFEEMDRLRAEESLARAMKEFLADEEA